MEEVGCLGEGQEEDLRPPHCPPHPEGEGPEGVKHHQGLPHEEGGATDEARAPIVRDSARGVIRRDNAC